MACDGSATEPNSVPTPMEQVSPTPNIAETEVAVVTASTEALLAPAPAPQPIPTPLPDSVIEPTPDIAATVQAAVQAAIAGLSTTTPAPTTCIGNVKAGAWTNCIPSPAHASPKES